MNAFEEIELFGAGMISGVIAGVVVSSSIWVSGVVETIAPAILCAMFSLAWVLVVKLAKWAFNKIFGGKKC